MNCPRKKLEKPEIGFSVGDEVNYCNGLIFKIVKIDEKSQVCYDTKGMWYALTNCVNICPDKLRKECLNNKINSHDL